MSDTDSFISEVNDELRRDQLYAYVRRYGWIAVLAVVVLVGGAAWNEYFKARTAAAAQANGDALNAALREGTAQERAMALEEAQLTGDAVILKAYFEAAELSEAGEVEAALAVLAPFTTATDIDPLYRDLAILKTAMIGADVISPEERIAQLAGIAAPGAPYRLLAEEQIAAAQAELGEFAAAIEGLRAISEDALATAEMRQRTTQMIIALGGDPSAVQE